jgi:hypothetical protein
LETTRCTHNPPILQMRNAHSAQLYATGLQGIFVLTSGRKLFVKSYKSWPFTGRGRNEPHLPLSRRPNGTELLHGHMQRIHVRKWWTMFGKQIFDCLIHYDTNLCTVDRQPRTVHVSTSLPWLSMHGQLFLSRLRRRLDIQIKMCASFLMFHQSALPNLSSYYRLCTGHNFHVLIITSRHCWLANAIFDTTTDNATISTRAPARRRR